MNTRDAKLALVAAGSLVLYVLACRPAFSPDGSKIAFPAMGAQEEERLVWVYDRTSGEMTQVLTLAKGEADEAYFPSSAWTDDGQELVCIWPADDDVLRGAVIPLAAPEKKRAFAVEGKELSANVIMSPTVQGNRLFVADEDGIAIVDLKTGRSTLSKWAFASPRASAPKGVYTLASGGNLYCVAGVDDEVAEILRLERNPWWRNLGRQTPWRMTSVGQFKTAEKEGCIVALAPGAARLAYVSGEQDNQTLTFLKDGAVEKTLTYGATNGTPMIGVLVWSPDGKTLFAAGAKENDGSETNHAAYLCEVGLDGWTRRETPVFAATNSDSVAFALYMLALSPDGKTAAMPDTMREDGEQALCLIDLSGKDRPVKRVPVPGSRAPAPKS